MKKELVIALRMTVATLVLTGLVYPLAVTGLAQVLFPCAGERQPRLGPGTCRGLRADRPGLQEPGLLPAAPIGGGCAGYDAANSGGSNLGATSQKLRDRIAADVTRLRAENPQAPPEVPAELVTTSASGFDPHISPEAARWQVPRVAAARGVAAGEVQALVDARTEPRTFGFLGEPRVNVLLLNLDLDERFGPPKAQAPATTPASQGAAQ